MKSVTRYNALNGTVVSREEIVSLLQTAKDEEQIHIEKALTKLLGNYPEAQRFSWENSNKAIEIIPNSMLHCLDCDPIADDLHGLGKAVAPDAIYQMITDQIIEALEKPVDKWEMEWGADESGYLLAYNFITKKAYRSINQLVLNPHVLAPVFPILKNPYFLTFSQIETLKGKVKKGTKAHQVTYYNFTYSYKNDNLKLYFKTSDEKKFIDWIKNNKVLQRLGLTDGYLFSFVNENKFAFLKYYNVFNGSDIEGIDFKLDQFDLFGKLDKIKNHHEKLPICETIIASYPEKKPKFTFGGTSAHFMPATDTINMPNISQFNYVQAYYTTYFHEMVHSTGIESRLKRDMTGRMKGNAEQRKLYYFEELIAELGAVFLCSQSGILHFTKRNSLAYLKGYRDGLVKIMKEDNKFIFKASTQSQKACDFLLQNVDFDNLIVFDEVKETPKKPVKTAKKSTIKPVVRTRNRAKKEAIKVDKNGQIALFGPKNKSRSTKPLTGIIDGLIVHVASSLLGTEKGENNPAWFPKYTQFKNKPKEAIKHLLKVKKGDCIGALYRKDIGYIDIPFGENDKNNKGFGLKHIVEKHGKEIEQFGMKVEDFIPIVVMNGKFKVSRHKNRIDLVGSMFKIVIVKEPNKTFVLTSFDLRPLAKGLTGVIDGIDFENEEITKSIHGSNFTGNTLQNQTQFQNQDKVTKIVPIKEPAPVNSIAHRLQNKKNVTHEYYDIPDKVISTFLGKIEKKPKESVAITIAGGQGSMKTRLCFRLMNAFAQKYKVGHASIEEHPESALYEKKVHEYLNIKAMHNIDNPEIENIADVHKLVRENDVIIIDSFSKLQEMDRSCQLDKDFRKAYDGKLFIIIYQLTGDGKMRGGSKSQFDGDCIAFIEKNDNYKENFVYWDKNRYQDKPELKYNIFSGKLQQEAKAEPNEVKPMEKPSFSFNIV